MQRIISITCIVVSLIMLCTIQFRKYDLIINDFRSPELCEINPVSSQIILSNPSLSVKNITNKENTLASLYAASACLMDVTTGRILFSDNSDKTLPMASTTKIMTCILALESGKASETLTVSKYASTMPDVQLNIKEGEQYLLNDMLYSLMLESHNDTAVAIAEHIGGSVEGFAEMMNAKAAELGCCNTHFVTPNGLDSNEHYTTAEDLCRIASYAINNQDFRNIIATKSYTFNNTKGSRTYTVNNHDAFLSMYDGALGIKTGFTGKAGYCFVGAATRNGTTLVSSVLASGWPPNKSYKWHDTKALMNYGFNNYTPVPLLAGKYSSTDKPDSTGNIHADLIQLHQISVQDGNGYAGSTIKKLNISFQADCTIPLSASDNVTLSLELPPFVSAPVIEGEIVGTASLCLNNEEINEYPIIANTEVPIINVSDIAKLILRLFTI